MEEDIKELNESILMETINIIMNEFEQIKDEINEEEIKTLNIFELEKRIISSLTINFLDK